LGRDTQGQLDGILYESAMELVGKVIPERTVEQTAAGIAIAQANLWRMGVTSVHDFDQARCFSALQQLHQERKLKLRVVKSIPLELLPHATALGLRSGFGDDWLRIGSVKCFADGALGPQTAAMLQGYENNPQNTGLLFMDAEQFYEIGQQAAASGLSLAIHAIGDRANHVVIDAYAQLRQYETQQHLPHLRHRIEHVQVLHPQDLPRLAEHQIIASVQPIHATSDMLIAERYWGARSQGAYAFRSLLDSGARLAFGSDAPVEAPNPFWGIHAAVTRCRSNGDPDPQGWYPQQRLSLHEALAAYTTGPAFAAGMEDRLGQLAPGYLADLIVLSSNPFEESPSNLHQLQPCAVMIGGKWVLQN
jgi:predicted amidohydrolase YtcJ